jgi:hypothetical protein
VLVFLLPARRGTFMAQGSSPAFLDPLTTLADVDRIADASSESTDGTPLVERVLNAAKVLDPEAPGAVHIQVRLWSGSGTLSTWLSVGWPTPWLECWRTSYYTDAVARTGKTAATINPGRRKAGLFDGSGTPELSPRDRWAFDSGVLVFRPDPVEVGGDDVHWHLRITPLLGSLAAFVALISLATIVLRWVLKRRRARMRAGAFAATVVLAALVLMAGTTWLSVDAQKPRARPDARPRQATMTPPIYFVYDFPALPISREQVEMLRTAPDGDRQLAQAFRRALLSDGADQQLYLTVVAVAEGFVPTGAYVERPAIYPIVHEQQFSWMRRPDFGAAEPMPAREAFAVRLGGSSPHLTIATGSGLSITRFQATVSTATMLVALFLMLTFDTWCLGPIRGLLGMRRRRGGLCPLCRHPLAPVHEAARPAP